MPTASGLSPDVGGGHRDGVARNENGVISDFDAGLHGSSPNLRAKKGRVADPAGIELHVMDCEKDGDVEQPVPAGEIQEEYKVANDTSEGKSIQF